MDIAVYLIAAAILIVLIVFALKVRGSTQEADEEQQRDVVRAAGPRQRAPEERGAEEELVEEEEEEEQQNLGPTAKMELEEREERKKMQDLREQERRQEDEKERQMENKQEEEEQRAKEEQDKREEEEYLKLKASFTVEEQGEEEQLSEDQSRNLLQEFIQHIEVRAADLFPKQLVVSSELQGGSPGGPGLSFWMRTQDAICRLQDLLAQGSLTDELDSVAQFMKKRGRVSITELAQASNSLINLTPESRSSA
ncbi:hypothetical protein F7725_009337 [Dissostichus mawsoni]|uniref:DDRGK domain-containing protein 1 n=1 Tax=Dissostichus mawsoni TaxID=36200 RepID=A0A7J5ZAU4_DISMA|nr:hypothetical protein F7725_009337 [Dissostichus mawsoni]